MNSMEILNQFGINPLLLAAQVVNFLILLFILKKFLYGPILKVLEARKQRIEQSLKNAEEIELQLQKTREQSEKMIAKTLEESQKILDETNAAAAQILEGANKTAERILLKATDDGKKIVELQKGILMRQVREHAGNLVALTLEKVTGKKITKKDQLEIIDTEVRNLS